MNTYKALAVANYAIFVNPKLESCPAMSNMRLQYFLYFTQLMSIRFRGVLLFSDKIEAWRYGPVVPEVYNTFNVYGSLTLCTEDWDILAEEDKTFIRECLIACRKLSTFQLYDISRKHEAWASSCDCGDKTISEDKLRDQAWRNGYKG